MSIKPVHFVSSGTEIQIKYDSLTESKFYNATVKSVNNYGSDKNGYFVNCQIILEDDDEEEVYLHNNSFEESWKMKRPDMTLLIKYLIETNEKIDDIENSDPREHWIYVASKMMLNFSISTFLAVCSYKFARDANIF